MLIGVLAVQGAVTEHVLALRRAGAAMGVQVDAVAVRTPGDLVGAAGLVIPGGESTTISRLLRSSGLQAIVKDRAGKGDLAVFGTCAGLILAASKATHDVEDKDIELLGLLDVEVDRNAFGRQRDSFEADLVVEGVGTVPAVFIRAPVVTRAGTDVRVLARNDRGIVAVESGTVLGTAFHPELTGDTRVHERFIRLCQQAGGAGR